MAILTLENLGVAFIIYIFWRCAKGIYEVVYMFAIGPAINKVNFKAKGKWALVTGCTDGIGKQYARELAGRGCNIILISRSMDKLRTTASEIERDYKVQTKVVEADFTAGVEIYPRIEKEIAGLEIGVLVNNVGISYPYPEYFLDLPEWDTITSNLVKANVVSLTRMTKFVLPDMVKRKRGVIINIGSASSIIPSPLLTVYAATKAYVDKFSEGLVMEYGHHGIYVQCVMPGFVCSNMSGIRKSSFFAPTAKEFVKSAIGLVGTVSRTTGYFPHAFFVDTINAIFDMSNSFCLWLVTRSMEKIRKKSLKKYKKQKNKQEP